ncbi:MAG TPA: hypothetical protein VFE05_20190 [Longimicrobiaceae bacterium]|jgi:hypothetical protein|nr:hypothetical protein [Longimicrobiaceae bacterium]
MVGQAGPLGPSYASQFPTLVEPSGFCPRCAYAGPGAGHFSRGRNVAKLVGCTVVTGGIMGAGGLAYYLLRKDHRLCPRCGMNWGKFGEHGVSLDAAGQGTGMQMGFGEPDARYRRGSIVLFAFAALLLLAGVIDLELPPILFGLLFGGGGYMLHRKSESQREARREALIGALQPPVLKLAAERQGRLTVTDVATSLGWAVPRAEKVLNSLDDGIRVSSDVTDEGVILYEFRELLHAPERLASPQL